MDEGSGIKKSEGDRLKCAINESTRAPLTRSPFPNGEGKEEAASPPKKEANPASLRSAAPSKGRGSRGYSLLPLEGGAQKGRRLDGDGGVKESEGDLLKYAINESTLSTADAVPLPPMGKAAIRGYRFSRIVKANTRICRKRITTDKAFPAWVMLLS